MNQISFLLSPDVIVVLSFTLALLEVYHHDCPSEPPRPQSQTPDYVTPSDGSHEGQDCRRLELPLHKVCY